MCRAKIFFDQHRERCPQLNMHIQNETQNQIDIQKLVQQKPLLESLLVEYNEKLENLMKVERLNITLIARNKDKGDLEEEK